MRHLREALDDAVFVFDDAALLLEGDLSPRYDALVSRGTWG
jgi:hypothetical protein